MNREQVIERLESIRSWKHNWDGEGGLVPDQECLRTAQKLAGLLPSIDLGVDLNADSQPTIHLGGEFRCSESKEGWILIEPDYRVSFCIRTEDYIVDGFDLQFDGEHLPPTLSAALQQILS